MFKTAAWCPRPLFAVLRAAPPRPLRPLLITCCVQEDGGVTNVAEARAVTGITDADVEVCVPPPVAAHTGARRPTLRAQRIVHGGVAACARARVCAGCPLPPFLPAGG